MSRDGLARTSLPPSDHGDSAPRPSNEVTRGLAPETAVVPALGRNLSPHAIIRYTLAELTDQLSRDPSPSESGHFREVRDSLLLLTPPEIAHLVVQAAYNRDRALIRGLLHHIPVNEGGELATDKKQLLVEVGRLVGAEVEGMGVSTRTLSFLLVSSGLSDRGVVLAEAALTTLASNAERSTMISGVIDAYRYAAAAPLGETAIVVREPDSTILCRLCDEYANGPLTRNSGSAQHEIPEISMRVAAIGILDILPTSLSVPLSVKIVKDARDSIRISAALAHLVGRAHEWRSDPPEELVGATGRLTECLGNSRAIQLNAYLVLKDLGRHGLTGVRYAAELPEPRNALIHFSALLSLETVPPREIVPTRQYVESKLKSFPNPEEHVMDGLRVLARGGAVGMLSLRSLYNNVGVRIAPAILTVLGELSVLDAPKIHIVFDCVRLDPDGLIDRAVAVFKKTENLTVATAELTTLAKNKVTYKPVDRMCLLSLARKLGKDGGPVAAAFVVDERDPTLLTAGINLVIEHHNHVPLEDVVAVCRWVLQRSNVTAKIAALDLVAKVGPAAVELYDLVKLAATNEDSSPLRAAAEPVLAILKPPRRGWLPKIFG